MADEDRLVGELAEENGLNVANRCADATKILLGDATESCIAVQDAIIWFDQRLLNGI